MSEIREPTRGRFSVELELANNEDVFRLSAGLITGEQVRRTRVRGVVDTGAARLVIPESTAKELGLPISGTAKVRYADGRVEERFIAQSIRLSFGGREGVFNAIVEPARDSALVGAIVLEDLDFVVDCAAQRLVPRDPKYIVSEVE